MKSQHPDSDEHKGATESESPNDTPKRPDLHSSLADQIGHRNSDPMLKDNDTDFPEPGPNAEHSGQHE